MKKSCICLKRADTLIWKRFSEDMIMLVSVDHLPRSLRMLSHDQSPKVGVESLFECFPNVFRKSARNPRVAEDVCFGAIRWLV